MSFKKIVMGKDLLFTTIVQDIDGRKIEEWKVMKPDYPKVVKILNNKFGLKMIIKERRIDTDLEWTN